MPEKLTIKNWPTDRLIPYARNPRRNDDAVDRMAGAIREFGFKVPIVAKSDGTVVDGHLRLKAAIKLGIPEVPVALADDLTEAQIKAFRILANKSAEWAEWDTELLALEMEDLKELGVDLELTGFSGEELAEIAGEPEGGGMSDPGDVPQMEESAVSVRGDVWIMGDHRLMCGDSTIATDVEALLAGQKPHLMVTDPPYGVNYDPEWRIRVGMNPAHGETSIGAVENDSSTDWGSVYALSPAEVAYVWMGDKAIVTTSDSLEASGYEMRSQIIWAKSHLVPGRGNYHYQHEACWYAVKKGATAHWEGGRDKSTLWRIEKNQTNETGHSTQKPIECMRWPIENNSKPGDGVYEPFSGSGTTIIAAEQTGRRCFAMEIHPPYVDMAVRRWQTFSGKEAVLEGDGRTFAEVEAERKGPALRGASGGADG